MTKWTDKGRTLYLDEIRTLLRDACAMLGKCNDTDPPATVVKQSPDQLRFDIPPLAERPDHQKLALAYVVVLLLNDANVYISPNDFPREYFATKASTPLDDAATEISNVQEYPAH